MNENTIIELVDKLTTMTERAVQAEIERDRIFEELNTLKEKYGELDERYGNCVIYNKELMDTIKRKDETISWGYNERQKLEKQLEALKNDSEGD